MKCTVQREQILDAVLHAEKNTIRNHTLPVLACILLTVSKDTLTVTATNLEVGIRFTVPVKDSEEGVVAVSGSVLSHVVSSLSKGSELVFESAKGYLHIKTKESSSKITLQDTEDFPTLPTVKDGDTITLPSSVLKSAINSVVYCASTSTIKPELSSVFIHPNGGSLTTAATDSFRLAEKTIPLKESVESEPLLIPSKSTGHLLRVLDKTESVIELHTNKHQLSVSVDGVYITLRLTNGTFPDYTQIIPKEFITEATVLTYDFDRVLKKATAFSDQFNQTKLNISPKKKQFTVYTKNENIGETTDTVNGALSGEDIEISFNQKYLIDALHSIESDSISLQFAGQSQPVVVRPIGDQTFLYLVMPMNR